MSTRQQLLAAIVDQPAEDTVRLAFADWLQESGEPGDSERAEFIRVQIELENKPCDAFMYSCHENGLQRCQCKDYGRYDELRGRELRMLVYETSVLRSQWWLDLLRMVPRINLVCPGFECQNPSVMRRGFISHLTLEFADLLAHAGELFAANPIERVTIRGAVPNDTVYGHEDYLHIWLRPYPVNGTPETNPAVVPDEVYSLLMDDDEPTGFFGGYASLQRALNALSAASIAYGRQQARSRATAAPVAG